jgi:hypothetical protein
MMTAFVHNMIVEDERDEASMTKGGNFRVN